MIPMARTKWIAVAALLALPGCVSLGGKAPPQLLSLDAAQKVAPGAERKGGQSATLIVADPEAPRVLDTVRVPVKISATGVAYVKDAQWADTPRHLFQKLLSETIAATSDRLVLDPGQYSAAPGQRLSGELMEFGIDAGSRSAIVTFDAMLSGQGGSVVARRRFTASAPVAAVDAASIGGPLNSAANKVAADVAAWIGGQVD